MKKFWFFLFLLCVAFGTLRAFATSDDHYDRLVVPAQIFQTITADSRTSRTITWRLADNDDEQNPAHFIEYRPLNGHENRLPARTIFVPTDEGQIPFHTATLTGLIPSTVYEYRIGGEGILSEWYTLTTEPAENISFSALIFGDSQSTDYTVWKQTVTTAFEKQPNAAFFINMGDLVDNGAQFYQWKAWLDSAQPLLERIPVAPLSGNHEYYSIDWKFSPAAAYAALFSLPENGAPKLKQQTYSFDYGNAHFVVLDTQAEETADFDSALTNKQLAWLENDLKSSSKIWKIILMHRGTFSYPDTANLNELGQAFVPIFDRCGVDIVFTAHIHTYGRTVPLLNAQPAEKGPVYISTGRSGDKVWGNSLPKPFETVFDPALDQPNYLTLDVSDKLLTVYAFKLDGQVFDTLTLQK